MSVKQEVLDAFDTLAKKGILWPDFNQIIKEVRENRIKQVLADMLQDGSIKLTPDGRYVIIDSEKAKQNVMKEGSQ